MNSNKVPKQLADIPMSDEVKNEWVNDPLSKTLDKWLSSGPSEMRLINLENKNMITKIEAPKIFDEWYKGFPDTVRSKLAVSEIAREGCGHSVISYTESRVVLDSRELNDLANFLYDNSKRLIEMIINYGPEAYYVKPNKKYFIKLPVTDYPYFAKSKTGKINLYATKDNISQTTFTQKEIKDIDSRLTAFAVPVEEDDE